ncbi:zeta toxin family protein [Chromobacterium amazonense]|uniref:zeta toxin family protein n=1 Tax=Chromobacterium amazonense TaxID=1382803 RepID=UPI001CB8CE1C|nr:zeta toxin family protein [Chromobacterium amazonense]
MTDRYLMGRLQVVNPDNITREQPGIGAIQAGKIAIRLQQRHLSACESFAWETTLSGNRELALMREAKVAGYKVNLVFVGLRNARASILRVVERVAAGGHDIPPADVARRLERSLRNLPEALVIADRAFIFDNSGERRRLLLLARDHNQSRHVSRNLPRWIIDAPPASVLRDHGMER